MHTFIHKAQYYETDKMGITHHSNYIRWMEEARADYLKKIGYGMRKLEDDGITSPVVSVECQYKHSTPFDDEVRIEVSLEKHTGVKLVMGYTMANVETGTVVLTAKSSHCFIDADGNPIALKKHFPEFHTVLNREANGEVYHTYAGQPMRDFREVLARRKDFVTTVFKPEPEYLGEAIPIGGNGDLTNDR